MNTWEAWGLGDAPLSASGAVLHSVPPLLIVLAAEAGPGLRERLTEADRRTDDDESLTNPNGPLALTGDVHEATAGDVHEPPTNPADGLCRPPAPQPARRLPRHRPAAALPDRALWVTAPLLQGVSWEDVERHGRAL
ncbi:MAG: hypothetical protein H7Y15_08155, partial [Pseudonocardia sp.]|nr:hypothetical protein [Pseudonocardia sp.]